MFEARELIVAILTQRVERLPCRCYNDGTSEARYGLSHSGGADWLRGRSSSYGPSLFPTLPPACCCLTSYRQISPHLEEECPNRGQGCNEINSLLEHRLRLLTKAPPATGLLVPWVGLYRLIMKSAMQGSLRFGRRRQRGLLFEAKARIDSESELR